MDRCSDQVDGAGPGFADLVARASALAAAPGSAVLGITGSPGSGKTTLAEALPLRATAGAARWRTCRWTGSTSPTSRSTGSAGSRPKARRTRSTPVATSRCCADCGGRRRAVVYAPAFERDLEQPLAGAIAVPGTARLVVTEGNYLLLDGGRWPAVRRAAGRGVVLRPDPECGCTG